MYLHVFLAVDEAEDVVAGNRVTAFREDIHADGALGDDAGFLLVEALTGRNEFRQVVIGLRGFLLAGLMKEGHVFAPTGVGIRLLFLIEHLSILVAEHHRLFTERDEEVLVGVNLMELAEAIDELGRQFEVLLLQPLVERVLTGFLQFAVLTPEDGLYL